MRLLNLILCLLLWPWVGCGPAPRTIDPELGSSHPLYDQLVQKTVIITSKNVASVRLTAGGGTEFTVDEHATSRAITAGRGCLVSTGGLVLTAAHNLVDLPRFKLFVFTDGAFQECRGTTLSVGDPDEADTDVALIRVEGVRDHACFVVDRGAAIGAKVLKYGFGFASGSIVDRQSTATADVISCRIAAEQGESGGPVVDYQGRLLGISSRITGFHGHLEIVLPKQLPND
ncbi:MAG: trypsin-like peptidase domain-containing protein [Planctomycetes bacterium]|nr:trypsin-like peptidase domain-containing protein [Planctomycetota bacterium]